MIVKDEFLSKLRRYFGLNLYEVKIWAALLSRGVSSAGELSDIANVPRSRSYDVLESLEKKGFIVNKMGKPIKYIAIPPKEVVERLKKNLRKDAEAKVKRLDELKDSNVLNELNVLHTQGIELVEPTDLSGSLKGRHNLYDHLELTIKSAEKEVIIMTTTEGLLRKVDALLPVFDKLKKRGVKIRIAAPLTKECRDICSEINKVGELRDSGTLTGRFVIVDGKEITFMMLDDATVHPSYDLGIWVNTPFFTSALSGLFDLAWKEMVTAEKLVKKK